MQADNEMKVPFFDLKRQYSGIKEEVLEKVKDVYENTAFTGGKFVAEFEELFATYCGTAYASGVNSGTSALHVALRALQIGEGDEVILPSSTFIATAWAILYVNATPVFVDCDPQTWQIDPNDVKRKITAKTKAVIGVHLYGLPYDTEAIQKIADENNLAHIEDAAQAHGAIYKDAKAGGLSDIACFSFYPGKNLGTYGEGGAVTTNSQELDKRVKMLRNHASEGKYYHLEEGYNMRMGGAEAAVLTVKMKYIDHWTSRRKEIVTNYREKISNAKLKWQHFPENRQSSNHLCVITVEDRQHFIDFMNGQNVFPGLHYPVPCHLQKAFGLLGYQSGDLPNAEYLSEHCVSLPLFPELTDQEMNKVIDTINNY
jgi:dTDP-4-amino-4,6-dideoxygalactose transaminase